MIQKAAFTVLITVVICSTLRSQAHDPRLPATGLTDLGGGWWSVTVEQLVDPSDYVHKVNPACQGDYNSRLTALLGLLRSASEDDPRLGVILPLLANFAEEIGRFVRKQGGDIGRILEPDRYANCIPIGVRTGPARIRRVIYRVGDGGNGVAECRTDLGELLACEPIGWAGWENALTGAGEVQVGFVSIFKNWSHDRHRWANMTVEFQPAGGVTPTLVGR